MTTWGTIIHSHHAVPKSAHGWNSSLTVQALAKEKCKLSVTRIVPANRFASALGAWNLKCATKCGILMFRIPER